MKKTKISTAERKELTREDAPLKLTKEQKEKLQNGLKMGKLWDYTNPDQVKVNDIIFGQFIGLTHYEKGNIKNDLLLLNTEDGERNIWSNTVLRSKFEELGIKRGSIVAIEYLGKKKSGNKGKKEYHSVAVSKI